MSRRSLNVGATDHLEQKQKQANKKVKHETGDGASDEDGIEIEYIAKPLFPSAALSGLDDNVIAGAIKSERGGNAAAGKNVPWQTMCRHTPT